MMADFDQITSVHERIAIWEWFEVCSFRDKLFLFTFQKMNISINHRECAELYIKNPLK